ncbi:MAG: hypothetical protein ACE5JI_08155, partial [Acidobacteriota bacterium]
VLAELRETLAKARQARDRHSEELGRFREENEEELIRIELQLRKNPDFPLDAREVELHSKWQEYRKGRLEKKNRLMALRAKLALDREAARKSLGTWSPIDQFDGDEYLKEVLVCVETREGKKKSFRFTLKKHDLTRRSDGGRPQAHWIIVDIRELTSGSP